MNIKKVIIILICAILILFVLDILAEKSVIPIKNDTVLCIEFRIYPQDSVNFTVTDYTRINEIVSIINSLAVEKSDRRPENMGEYFYNIHLQCSDGGNIWVELDESTISLGNENYIADTKVLHDILKKTYYDIQNGNIG